MIEVAAERFAQDLDLRSAAGECEANDFVDENLSIEVATAGYFPSLEHATLDMIRARGGIVGLTAPPEKLARAV